MTDEDEFSAVLDAAQGTPWEPNEDGLWCINCGNHIAAPWNITRSENYAAPSHCDECGFPDFGA